MSAPCPAADQLRARARALRSLAMRIEGCSAVVLHQRAGADTWVGPTPERCLQDLLGMRTRLISAADGLRTAGARLDLQADNLQATANATTGVR